LDYGQRQRLKAALAASPKSRRQVAKDAGIPYEKLSRLTNAADENPTLDMLTSIADAAGTTVAFITNGSGHAFSPDDYDEIDRHEKWLASKQLRISPAPNAEIVSSPQKLKGERRRKAPAGVMLLADQSIDDAEIPSRYRDRDAEFVIRSLDDSMNGAGILEGDVLFAVRPPRDRMLNGRIVVCRLGKETYVKRLLMNDRITLLSENARYSPMVADAKEIEIIGVVIGRMGDVAGYEE
jgi:SOS-response transcriptional repressor LexA